MTIYDQINQVLNNRKNDIITLKEMKYILRQTYGTNPGSVVLTDYCYNRFKNGINFKKHIFEYIKRGTFKYLGENYPYTGKIYHKPKGQKSEIIIGEWNNGVKTMLKSIN